MDDITNAPHTDIPFAQKLLNIFMLIITLILSVVSFFAMLDIVLFVATLLVIQSPDSNTIQQKYTISSIRNVWGFISGCLMLAFLVISVDYHTRRLGNYKTTRILLLTLVIEIIIISIRLLL